MMGAPALQWERNRRGGARNSAGTVTGGANSAGTVTGGLQWGGADGRAGESAKTGAKIDKMSVTLV